MKKNIAICIVACILSCVCCSIFFSYSPVKSLTVQPVRMLIPSCPGSAPCILEVYPNGILEVSLGNLDWDSSFYSRKEFRDNVERKWRKLSAKDCRVIDDLVNQIVSECDEEYRPIFLDMPTANVVINDKHYRSLLFEIGEYPKMRNKAVSELAHKLIKLSPVDLIYEKML